MPFLIQGKTNWKFIIIFLVIAVVLATGVLWYSKNVSNYNYQVTVSQNYGKAQQRQNPGKVPALSYNDAARIYKDRRIQFDAQCLLFPNYVVFKKGTTIMLDNRYSKARPVYLDGTKYVLGGYGFALVTLNTDYKLPHTIKINCGTGKNNGRIFLEQ